MAPPLLQHTRLARAGPRQPPPARARRRRPAGSQEWCAGRNALRRGAPYQGAARGCQDVFQWSQGRPFHFSARHVVNKRAAYPRSVGLRRRGRVIEHLGTSKGNVGLLSDCLWHALNNKGA